MAKKGERLRVGVQDPTRPPHSITKITARIADRLRLDSYWFIDHFMGLVPPGMWSRDLTPAARLIRDPDEFFDPLVSIAAVGARTKRIRLGVGVVDTLRLSPAWIARMALTLQHTTKGRFILGIGAGERENTEPYGLEATKLASRCEEALRVIRLLWSSRGPVDFEGEFFRLNGASMALRPYLKRPPPLWLAAMGPRMLDITGRYADGWLPHSLSPQRYEAALATIRASATAAGRDPKQVTPGMVLTVLIDSSHEVTHEALESPALRLGALIFDAQTWRDVGGTHPFGEGFRGILDFVPTRMKREDVMEAMEKVPWDVIHALFPHGTPDDVAEKTQAYVHAGLRHAVFENVTAVGRPQKALSSFAALARTVRIARAMPLP
ncbi:MAG: LLM class flavin-dependent oxidoreductase [Actinomycetota bacterium]|nr:LLM class flavin-dependent oxidoreductase [Actinomycetota bacterium]